MNHWYGGYLVIKFVILLLAASGVFKGVSNRNKNRNCVNEKTQTYETPETMMDREECLIERDEMLHRQMPSHTLRIGGDDKEETPKPVEQEIDEYTQRTVYGNHPSPTPDFPSDYNPDYGPSQEFR